MIVELVETVAMYIGYVVLGMVAITVLLGMLGSRAQSTGAQDNSYKYGSEDYKTVNEIVQETIEGAADYSQLHHEPAPVSTCDWSMNKDASKADLRTIKAGLEDAGMYVHPFPTSPHGGIPKDWGWGTQHIGIWSEKPQFYLEANGQRTDVTPDLSDWEMETDEEYTYAHEKEYGYRDSWERENIHRQGSGS